MTSNSLGGGKKREGEKKKKRKKGKGMQLKSEESHKDKEFVSAGDLKCNLCILDLGRMHLFC